MNEVDLVEKQKESARRAEEQERKIEQQERDVYALQEAQRQQKSGSQSR